MTQPNTPVRVTVRDHFGKQFELDPGQCPSFGIAVKPSYLEQTPQRLGSDWIAQRLMFGKKLELRRIGNDGTWFVVDLEEMQGEVINLDQLRDLKPDEVSLDVDDERCPLRMKIETQGYRALRNTCWGPSGVCALVGPNGSGKTTLLRLLEFLRNAYLRNVPSAMDQLGGVYGLRSWNASPDSPVSVALTIGDLRWEIELTPHSSTLASKIAETITCKGEIVLLRPAWGQQFNYRGKEISIESTDDRMALRVVAESSVGDEFHRFVEMLKKFRVYRSYNIYSLQENGSRQGGDLYLHPSGQNLFTVLRNWRDRRELKHKFEFVVTHMRQAFPEVFEDLNFDVAGLTVTADFTDPNSKESYPSALQGLRI